MAVSEVLCPVCREPVKGFHVHMAREVFFGRFLRLLRFGW